ncbi:hypothetical protein CCH79_00000680, partial [Gambusia affinis]
PGRYSSHDVEALENSDSGIGLCGWLLVGLSLMLMLVTLPISIWMCIKIVKEYERAIIFRLGRILKGGAKGPGLFFILPCTDNFINVDMRTITFDIPPQEVLTKDSVTVSVDGVVYYRVQNATLAVANITNADAATRLLAQTTLRNVLGTKNLAEILSDREEIAHSMQSTLDDATDDWGIKVERVEIKDVKLPLQLQRAMAAEAEASREARAKALLFLFLLQVIAAEGEMNASRALKEASLNSDSDIGIFGWLLVGLSLLLVLVTFPLSIWMCYKIVKEYERAIIFRLGRILKGGAKGPGLFFIVPCTDIFINVDMRTITFDIPPQEVLTKDSVTVSVDGVVYYRVQNATLAVANITNADAATRLLAQTTLRNVLGTKNLAEILSDREEIAHSMQATLDDATDNWGIKVERVEIKDVKLPLQLQRAMAAEAEASREARAKVIAAEGEMNASRALKEASLVISEAPSALQLRYLQTLNTIAAEKNSTIIFPLPMDMMHSLINR